MLEDQVEKSLTVGLCSEGAGLVKATCGWLLSVFFFRKLLKVGHMNFVREKFSLTHWFFIDFGSQLWADYFHPISVIGLKLLFDPSTLQSDKHPISPKTSTPKSNIEVMLNWCYGVMVNLKSVSRTFYLHRQGNL